MRDDRNAVDLSRARLDQVEHENIRHVVDRGRGVAQVVQQVHDALDVADRQRDEDDVRAMLLHVAAQGRASGPRSLCIAFHAEPIGAAIIEEAGHLEAHARDCSAGGAQSSRLLVL